ncbi:EcsC family protein [Bacillus tianshenii]|nr:EcsC family protein [Bacillus tianshenii]
MKSYEQKAYVEMLHWQQRMLKRSSMVERMSKSTQTKVNQLIPARIHNVVTESIKKMVQSILLGSDITTKYMTHSSWTFEKKEQYIRERLNSYKKTAALEGAGTGVGGLLLGMADFPLLLTIKVKFLFDTAAAYGFDVSDYEERLFILHVFQLAFSSEEHRKKTMQTIMNWEEEKEALKELDWRTFQQEYRDYIDLAKLFQLLPGIGAAVGAVANYRLLEHLGEVAMNAYRIRLLESEMHAEQK